MAGTSYAIGSDQLAQQRLGYMAISLTNFDDTLVSEIALGSRLEIAGAVVGFEANESMGANWAAMPQGNVYARIDSVALTSAYTTTAPTWDDELQGWYDATGQYRYYARLYKDAGGNYTQKALYSNIRGVLHTNEGLALNTGANGDQEIRFANDALFSWDEANDRWNFDKGLYVTLGDLIAHEGNIFATNGHIYCSTNNKGYHGIKFREYIVYGNETENSIFDSLAPYISTGYELHCSGSLYDTAAAEMFSVHSILRTGANAMNLYCMNLTTCLPEIITINNGGATAYRACIVI